MHSLPTGRSVPRQLGTDASRARQRSGPTASPRDRGWAPDALRSQRYSASTSTAYAVSIAFRFSFSDGVSSPCSSVN